MRVHAVEPGDAGAVRAFLASIFGVTTDATFLRADIFDWRYFQPRPDWDGPRSWVVKIEGQIVAHIGVWPLTLRTPTGPVTFVHPLDWAASPAFPGAGILLFRSFLRRTGTVLGLGGSEQSKRLLPSLGFEKLGKVDIYAKWLVRHRLRANTRLATVARQGMRLARKLIFRPLAERQFDGWAAVSVSVFPRQLDEVIDRSESGEHSFLWTGVQSLNFVLTCPIRSCKGFLLYQNGRLRGYFILSRPGNQSRIADLRVDSISPEDWNAAYLVATECAKDDPDAHEVTAYSSTELVKGALEAQGFRIMMDRDFRLHDHQKRISARVIQFHPIASDAFLLYNPKFPYLT
jgi:hypothetical protein